MEDVIWLKLEHKQSGHKFTVCICYLPPEGSSRRCDGEAFYSDLMLKFYDYQNDGDVIICGDFNSRCGDESDYIEGVDNIPSREVIDFKLNPYGQLLLDFLTDCNLCMLNGRLGENNFTNINGNGSSVVDYMIVPHEQLERYQSFKVHTMSSVINRVNMQGHIRSPEHSILEVTLQTDNVANLNSPSESSAVKPRYNLDDIPASFLNCETSFQRIMDTIDKIEKYLTEERDVQKAYTEFTELVKVEMDAKLPKQRQYQTKALHKPHKSRAKPYWTIELQDLWDEVCKLERLWLTSKRRVKSRSRNMQCVNSRVLRENFHSARRRFDKLNRQCKRKYQTQQQQKLQDDLENIENPRNFWSKIERLGIANDRITSIPWEIKDDKGQISLDRDNVLNKWKVDYECLFNGDQDNPSFDKAHLDQVREIIREPGSHAFPESDCSLLNAPISREEVRTSVYNTKVRKASGVDEIPAEVLRNKTCIDLLFKIIRYCFEAGKIPNEWTKGIINPIYKSEDRCNPVNYRPITLLSIPCKVYTDILNKRLTQWLEENNVLFDGQNGFRKGRSCLDHIYTLHTIISNRKSENKDTSVCFVDAKKAFDTVNRECLWFKLMSIGIKGKILNAIQYLYENLSCTVRINNQETDWFRVTQGVKQGCVISPTLFSIYVNDLAKELEDMQCELSIQETMHISVLFYADDIAIISETEGGMQQMLDKLNDWCNKWRIVINENKTKILHFRPKAKNVTRYNFICGKKKIELSSNYKYLGFWLNEFFRYEVFCTRNS